MRLGILGGTFDPIHQGHLLLAQTAQTQHRLDKVLFVPALIPPHKTSKRDMTPAPYRYKMTQLALLEHPDFEISDTEFNRPDISYTVDTLRQIQKEYPGAELFLLVGADAAANFSKWKDFGEIKKMAVILAAPRPGAAASGQEILWLKMAECGISSSEIRERVSEGKSLEKGTLPARVEAYIREMNLYSKGKQ